MQIADVRYCNCNDTSQLFMKINNIVLKKNPINIAVAYFAFIIIYWDGLYCRARNLIMKKLEKLMKPVVAETCEMCTFCRTRIRATRGSIYVRNINIKIV